MKMQGDVLCFEKQKTQRAVGKSVAVGQSILKTYSSFTRLFASVSSPHAIGGLDGQYSNGKSGVTLTAAKAAIMIAL